MQSVLHEPKIIQDLHTEYLHHIKYYQNIKRQGIFVKYLNIDKAQSTFNNELNSTYDFYSVSDIKFDIYDLTPVHVINSINNRSEHIQDIRGLMFDGNVSITLYTIDRPQLNDIVYFYPPITSNESFRVMNISTPINALQSTSPITWFQLELVYAPSISTDRMKKGNEYVYDLSLEKYITRQEYITKINSITKQIECITQLKKFYNYKYDMYCTSNHIASVVTNMLLYHHKKLYNYKYNRLYELYKSPYSFVDKFGELYKSLNEYPLIPITGESNNIFDTIDIKHNVKLQYYWLNKDKYINEIEEMLYYTCLLFNEMTIGD